MNGGDNPPPPPSDGGEFLLNLIQNHHNNHPQNHQQPLQPPYLPHNLSSLPDPAVAAVGPTIPIHNHHRDHHPFSQNPNFQNPNFFPKQQQGFHLPSFSPPSNSSSSQITSFYSAPHQHFDLFRSQQQQQQQQQKQQKNPFFCNSSSSSLLEEESLRLKKLQLELDLFKERELGFAIESKRNNGFDSNSRLDPRLNRVIGSPDQRGSFTPPGFLSKPKNPNPDFELFSNFNSNHNHMVNHRVFGSNSSSSSSKGYERERRFLINDVSNNSNSNVGVGLSGQLDNPGLPSGSSLHSDIERNFRGRVDDNEVGEAEIDDLSEQLVDSVLGDDHCDEKNDVGVKKKHFRDKDFRSDPRGKWILPQRMRNNRRLIECRRDIDRLDSQFIAIYESLIPVEEEKAKQKQLLTLLEQLVCKEWPNAKLYVYGSCANSFGVSKSDIDVCLAIDDQDINKSAMLLKLADILQSGNLQDVQALTHARVPIVKLMDPVTGISCDICINNVLAVVNTKLLRDYAEIDVRLRQLAYLVKHWAKSRGVNETYHGTLSSYAYVLMCIHFLQMRNPPILPCLQNMSSTYAVTVDDVECTFFDQVERLRNFGSRNRENISKLLWGFFSYWAYCHDYANQVISVRSGCILSKQEKDWTRRVGNDRHLICIEDPFETSHDLGRVVDKYSIRVLREEFERAAEIMQRDPNPYVTLFEPYIPR